MDFALLPPEINSARIYSGPGPGPLLAAAASWDALAAELHAVGSGYQSTIAELNNGWSGPSATAMTAAATPYASWMHTTSVQAEQTATQAKAAAAAYEAAFAMTVPPPVIAANRSLLMSLIATNFLGQNTPAIMATEAHYAEMWAQDATAMYTYAGSAAAASQLTPFTTPPRTTNSAGAANQAAAVGQTTATTGGSDTGGSLASVSQVLQGLAAPALGAAPTTELTLAGTELLVDSFGTFGVDAAGTFGIDMAGLAEIGGEAADIGAGLVGFDGLAGASLVSANMGRAATISALSVPQTWTAAAPTLVQQVASVSSTAGAASAVAAGETAVPFAEMAGAGLAGRATAGLGQGGSGRAVMTGRKRGAPPPPVRPGPTRQPMFSLLFGAEVELRELAELRTAGILTEKEYAEQKYQLLGR